MPLLRQGRNRIAGLITGNETCHYGTSGTSIWVAATTIAHDPASTWPQGSGVAATMESGYPVTSNNIFQHRAIFSTAQANFAWDNWWLNTATASGAGVPLNHASTAALGTKTNAQSWQITTCVTVTT
jgi:hypothetical protein